MPKITATTNADADAAWSGRLVDSATRPCCGGIGAHAAGCTTPDDPRADVAVPAGAVHADEWEDDDPQPYRIVTGARRGITDRDLIVWTSALQRQDGSLDVDRDPPTVNLGAVSWERGLTAGQARELAALLVEAADEIDGWVAANADDEAGTTYRDACRAGAPAVCADADLFSPATSHGCRFRWCETTADTPADQRIRHQPVTATA
jgi:hypothetical protein